MANSATPITTVEAASESATMKNRVAPSVPNAILNDSNAQTTKTPADPTVVVRAPADLRITVPAPLTELLT